MKFDGVALRVGVDGGGGDSNNIGNYCNKVASSIQGKSDCVDSHAKDDVDDALVDRIRIVKCDDSNQDDDYYCKVGCGVDGDNECSIVEKDNDENSDVETKNDDDDGDDTVNNICTVENDVNGVVC